MEKEIFFPIKSINILSDLAAYLEINLVDQSNTPQENLKEMLSKAAKLWADDLRSRFFSNKSRDVSEHVNATLSVAIVETEKIKSELDSEFLNKLKKIKTDASDYFNSTEKFIENLLNNKNGSLVGISTLVNSND